MLLVDTSALLAGYDRTQRHHDAVLRARRVGEHLILSPFVLAELDYLAARIGGQPLERVILEDVAGGSYDLAHFDAGDVALANRIIDRYASLDVGLADASIVVLAERHQCLDVLTLDQRHFRAIAGPGGKPFRILPFDE